MNVVFRTDASTQIGSGHVMRCATLADELQRRGCDVSFICRRRTGDYIEWLTARGVRVEPLLDSPLVGDAAVGAGQYASWLGVPMDQEISQVQRLLTSLGTVDWLVVDHYALDAEWEAEMRKTVGKILAIDDIANRAHDCDLLLDQNYYHEPERRYSGLISAGAATLLGPRYALLRPEFAFWRDRQRVRDGSVNRILLFMGGVDQANVTATVLRALASCLSGKSGLQIDAVIGNSNPHRKEIFALCHSMLNVTLHDQVDNMAELMAVADLAIGATGATTWERAVLGLPTLAVSVAENQRDIARYAEQCGLLTWLGDSEAVSISEWGARIADACANSEVLRSQSHCGLTLIDAFGVARVAEKML